MVIDLSVKFLIAESELPAKLRLILKALKVSEMYLGWGGRKLNTPEKSLQTLSLEATRLPSIV